MKQISFIHAADLHLDSPLVGLRSLPSSLYERLRESTFKALENLTAAAIERKVDFVILAGDLFDGEDRSLKAQSRLRKEMLRLSDHHIPVYVVHGNHDHMNGTWVELEMPDNVHVFNREVEVKGLQTSRGDIIHLYGFSYSKRHVYERKIADYQKKDGADFHIGILHGNVSGSQEHDNYAPFTVNELYEKGFDYWALGHIHKREILLEMPPVVYPGNIQGRNRKETGSKGIYHVQLTNEQAVLDFVETADIIWEEEVLDASHANSFSSIYELCQSVIGRIRKDAKGTLLTLHLQNVLLENAQEQKSLHDELLELLQEDEREEDNFVWPFDLLISEKMEIDKNMLKTEAKFYQELFETAEQFTGAKLALADLYHHHLGRRYLPQLTEKEQQELTQSAEQLLVQLLYKGGA